MLGLLTLVMCAAMQQDSVGPVNLEDGLGSWKFYLPETDATIVQKDGQQALKMRVDPSRKVDWYHLIKAVPVVPGKYYSASAEVLGEGVYGGHGAIFSILFLDENGRRLAHDDQRTPTGLNSWVDARSFLQAPDGATQVGVGVFLHGYGTAYFRNMVIEELPMPDAKAIDGPVTISVTDEIVCDSFVGYGFEDDGYAYNSTNRKFGLDDNAVALREKRIEWLDPGLVRMFFWYNDWNPGNDWETYTWNSDGMASHYKSLDVYQKIGTDVMVTGVEWGIHTPWTQPEKTAKAIGALLEHLIKTKGYTCIKYWSLTNEPDTSFAAEQKGDFQIYMRMHALVHKEIKRRGLDVGIIGSDDAAEVTWLAACVDNDEYYDNAAMLASHTYFNLDQWPLMPWTFREKMDVMRSRQNPKSLLITEFGFADHRTVPPAQNPLMREYPYAMHCHAATIEGLNQGIAAFVVWCLHEVYYMTDERGPMKFGLWDYGDNDWALRPVYHSVVMFTRNIKRGAKVRKCISTHPLSVSASMADSTLFWVNQSDKPIQVMLKGQQFSTVHVVTEETIAGEQSCGKQLDLDNDATFMAPPKSFGTAK